MAAKFTDGAHIVLTTDYSTAEVPEGAYRRLPQPALFANGGGTMLLLLAWVLIQVNADLGDQVLLIQPSSPFRTEATGWTVVGIPLYSPRFGNRHSVCSAEEYPARWSPSYQIIPGKPLPARRQDLPPAYRPDGGYYRSTARQIFSGSWGDMGVVSSDPNECLSIDTEDDWTEAERLVREEDQ
jgi:CMP-N-acetylneuraminic acid synthetase